MPLVSRSNHEDWLGLAAGATTAQPPRSARKICGGWIGVVVPSGRFFCSSGPELVAENDQVEGERFSLLPSFKPTAIERQQQIPHRHQAPAKRPSLSTNPSPGRRLSLAVSFNRLLHSFLLPTSRRWRGSRGPTRRPCAPRCPRGRGSPWSAPACDTIWPVLAQQGRQLAHQAQRKHARPTAHADQSPAQAPQIPPDQEADAIDLVLQQTEVIADEWARQELGDRIQATVAAHLQKSGML